MSDNPHSLSERNHPYLPGLWLAAGFLGLASLALLLRPTGITPDVVLEKAAAQRWEKLQKLKSDQEAEATTYGWVDKDKGVARIPVTKAVEMIVPRLRAENPRPAYPITTIAPSAITAAGYPLYPEVPADPGSLATAQAADGGSTIAATNKAAASAKPSSAVTSTNVKK